MGMNNRLKKIETRAKTKISGIMLIDGDMNQVEGTIERMPSANMPGLAVLSDGTQKVIKYEPNWRSDKVMFNNRDAELTDKLRIRRDGVPLIHFISLIPTRMVDADKEDQAHNEIILVDSEAHEIAGQVIRMPTEDKPGEARLSDGSVRAIIFESDWQSIDVMTGHADQEPEPNLRIRCGDVRLWIEEADLAYKRAVTNESNRQIKQS